MKTMVLHDYFQSAEGGGRLALELASHWGADLAYGFKVAGHPFFAGSPFSGHEVAVSRHSRIPILRQYRLARDFSERCQFLQDYDLVLYSGFYTPLAVGSHDGGRNIYYCHTPPRFVYDQRDRYLSSIPLPARPILAGFIRYLQPRYEQAVGRMDTIVTNSENVRRRISRYLGREAMVVYPPCDIRRFQWRAPENYYLSFARLDPLKRVDLIVEAFLTMPEKRLVVASQGSESRSLQRLARGAANVTFVGAVSEQEMARLIGGAIATIYIPCDEDFGLSPVESMAAGKPVIGVRSGGIPESVLDGENGVLLSPDPDTDELRAAVTSLTAKRAVEMRYPCEQRALLFGRERFQERMADILNPHGSQ